jgi:hypothetical protein
VVTIIGSPAHSPYRRIKPRTIPPGGKDSESFGNALVNAFHYQEYSAKGEKSQLDMEEFHKTSVFKVSIIMLDKKSLF